MHVGVVTLDPVEETGQLLEIVRAQVETLEHTSPVERRGGGLLGLPVAGTRPPRHDHTR
jgi:hypothetical protein